MKAFNESLCASTQEAGPILLFDGEVDPAERRQTAGIPQWSRRAQPGRYPDSGPKPRSRLPEPTWSSGHNTFV